MTTLDLTHLETLLAAATPGPWELTEQIGLDEFWGDWHKLGPLDMPGGKADKNTKLLLALRNAAPALIARVRELENPQIATVIEPDSGFEINDPVFWNALPLKARLIIQELSLQNDALKAELAKQRQDERDFLNYALL